MEKTVTIYISGWSLVDFLKKTKGPNIWLTGLNLAPVSSCNLERFCNWYCHHAEYNNPRMFPFFFFFFTRHLLSVCFVYSAALSVQNKNQLYKRIKISTKSIGAPLESITSQTSWCILNPAHRLLGDPLYADVIYQLIISTIQNKKSILSEKGERRFSGIIKNKYSRIKRARQYSVMWCRQKVRQRLRQD